MNVTAYRIARRQYAQTIWSGAGAREHGGRWNSKGVAVIYAAESRSLAAMEQLVHLVPPRILRGYVVAGITFDDARILRADPVRLPAGWDNSVAPPVLKRYGDDWVAERRTPVLAVPSIVIPGEWNFLINPAHPEFDRLPKSIAESFLFDSRLA